MFRQTAPPPIRPTAPDVDISADAGPSTNEVLSAPANEGQRFEIDEVAGGTGAGLVEAEKQNHGRSEAGEKLRQVKNKLLAIGDESMGADMDEQLPIDSEAERSFASGSQKFFKRPHQHHHHLTRDVAARLRAHENSLLLQLPNEDGFGSNSLRHRQSPVSPSLRTPSPRPTHARSPSFMERFRKSPLSALSSLRSRSPAARNTVRDDDGWSESSSSSEEEWQGGISPAASIRRPGELYVEE